MNKQNQKRNIKNNEISLVATDLDGTLLLQNKHISKRTYDVLKKANENGVHVVIATGRSFSALPESIFKIDGMRYVVTSNGANIIDLKDNEVIYKNCIDAAQIPKIIDFLKGRPYILEVFTGGKAYMSKSDYDKFRSRTIDFRPIEYVLQTRIPIADIFEFMSKNASAIENININFDSLSDKPKAYEELLKFDNITVTTSFDFNLEIGGNTTSKGDALNFLTQMLGLTSKNVLSIGDNPNDSSMLGFSEIAVAVENAHEDIIKLADHITSSNDEDGVAKAVEKFVLS